MKFVVSSSDLLRHLNAISRVISSKNTIPVLDNVLFEFQDDSLQLTASDLETTMITSLETEQLEGEGKIAIPAKILIDTLKEFAEQPLSFTVDTETFGIEIRSETGKFSIVGQSGEDFPQLPELDEEKSIAFNVGHDALLEGINKTIFATADDELRPVMNGILVEISPEDMTFVASDAHKLVRYRRKDAQAEIEASFILPKKPASLLRNLLPKEDLDVVVKFDEKNAYFELTNFRLVCRLVEGKYPSYDSVIPINNTNRLIVDRLDFYNTLKRVSVFSNQASQLVKLKLSPSEMVVSAQDIDFSISAVERLACTYEGHEMEIGFKASFLLEILSNLSTPEVKVELSDPTRAGLLLPAEDEMEDEDVLMLLMPMMINV